MYKDTSVIKNIMPCSVFESDNDIVASSLKEQAKVFFEAHQVPATLQQWLVQKRKLQKQLIKNAAIKFNTGLQTPFTITNQTKEVGFTIQGIYFETIPGVYATASLYIPDGNGPFPAIVNLHGHIQNGRLAASVVDRAVILAQNGFVCISMDTFGSGERSQHQHVSDYHGENPGASLFDAGQTLLGIQVMENMRCVDLLCSLNFVDKHNIGATGESGGGNQAMWLAAVDSRIKAVMPVVSVGTFEAYVMSHNCVCELLPNGLTFCEEAQVLGLIAPRALNVCNALQETNDAFSAVEMIRSVKAAGKIYSLYEADENFHVQIFNNAHEYSRQMQVEMLQWFTRHLKYSNSKEEFRSNAEVATGGSVSGTFKDRERSPLITTLPQYLVKTGNATASGLLNQKESLTAAKNKLARLLKVNIKSAGAIVSKRNTQHKRAAIIIHPNWQRFSSTHANDFLEYDSVIGFDLWGTGKHASSLADYYDDLLVSFHTLARTCLWLGKTVMGQWITQLDKELALLRTQQPGIEISLHGYKEAALAVLFYSVIKGTHSSIKLVDMPLSYKWLEPDAGDGFYSMAIHVPGIIPWGDVEKALAMLTGEAEIANARDIHGRVYSHQQVEAFKLKLDSLKQKYKVNNQILFNQKL